MKSYTMTLYRFTKPMPFAIRWGLRVTYHLPFALAILLGYFTTAPLWTAAGTVVGALWIILRSSIRSWLRLQSVALVSKKWRSGT